MGARYQNPAWGAAVLALWLLLLMGLAAAQPGSPAAASPADEEPVVVRAYYNTLPDIERLAMYDLWEVNNTAERYVLLAADADDQAQLKQSGWRIAPDANATATLRRSRARDLFLGNYRTVDELYADLDLLNATYPGLAELVTYGEGECLVAGGCTTPGGDYQPGYDLRALRITNEAIPGASAVGADSIIRGTKPVLFLIANIHAREITTPELAMRLADWLLEGYSHDPDATWLVDWHEIWIVPTANPEGHWLVELGTRAPYNSFPFSQRKNANQDSNGDGTVDCTRWPPSSSGQFGVDLNRNHSFGWGGTGASSAPCDLTFRGPAAASETEVSALEALVAAVILDQRDEGLYALAPDDATGIFITIHSFSELVLWPWGGYYLPAPNRDGLKAIGDKLASFNGYTSCQPTECLYAASGSSDDWAYGALGIPAFTFEVGDQFMPPYAEIDNVQWPDNKPAFLYAARIARTPYLTALGPDSHSGTALVSGETALLTVTLDDGDTGGQAIVAGEFAVGLPFWDPAHTANPLSAADGAFDSTFETATATLDVSGWPEGRTFVYFRGQDGDGNWGAVSAAFVTVGPENYSLYLPQVVRP